VKQESDAAFRSDVSATAEGVAQTLWQAKKSSH
jgi:hypothetical protein